MNKSACGICTLHAWEIARAPDEPDIDFFRALLEERITRLITDGRVSEFWLVMDQGLSCVMAEAILSLRHVHPLRLICVIPFEEQHLRWPEEERDRYFAIMQQCDAEYLLAPHFSLDCYQRSVEKLLEHCGSLFVVWNGRQSDAGDAITRARRKGCPVQSLNIASLARRE